MNSKIIYLNMLKLFKKIDFIGHPINFEIDNTNKYKTIQGAILSSGLFLVILVLALMFGKDIYERKNPNVFLSEAIFEHAQTTSSSFPFFVAFHNNGNTNLKPYNDYYDISVLRYYFDKDNKVQIERNLTLDSCRTMNFTRYDKLVKDFINLSNNEFLCVKGNENTITKGKYPQRGTSFVRVKIDFCDPELRSNCKITPNFQSTQPTIVNFYINTIIDASNYTNPIKIFIDSTLNTFSLGVYKVSEFLFSEDSFISDNGWILQDLNKISFISLKQINTNFNLAGKDNVGADNKRSVFEYFFKFTNTNYVTRRTYLKIQELFARVGGLVNAIFIMTQILFYNYFRFLYIEYIRHNLIEIQQPKINESKLSVSQFHQLKDENLNNVVNFNNLQTAQLKIIDNNLQDIVQSEPKELVLKESEPKENICQNNKNLEKKVLIKVKNNMQQDIIQNATQIDQTQNFNYFTFLNYSTCGLCFSKKFSYIKAQLQLIKVYIEIKSMFDVIDDKINSKSK